MLFQIATGGERLRGVFTNLQAFGFQDFVLPFLLIFALTFAVLQKIALFKEKGTADRKINGVLSAVIALLIVIPHVLRLYPPENDPILIMNSFLPGSAVIFVSLFLALLLIGFLQPEPKFAPLAGLLAIIGIIIVGALVVKAMFPRLPFGNFLADPAIQALGIVIGVMVLVIWFVAREERPKKPFAERITEVLGAK